MIDNGIRSTAATNGQIKTKGIIHSKLSEPEGDTAYQCANISRLLKTTEIPNATPHHTSISATKNFFIVLIPG